MKNFSGIAIVYCLLSILDARADASPEVELSAGWGFGISSAENGTHVVQLQGARLHPVFESIGKFKLGYGVRLSHFTADQILGTPFQVSALNAGIHAAYEGLEILDVGMNLDVIGFSFGNSTSETFNLLKGGKNDLGFLSSEFYVMRRFFGAKFMRLSYMHVATEQSPNAAGRRQKFTDLFGISAGLFF